MSVLYRPVGALLSVGAGLLAGAMFKRVWHTVAGGTEAPHATEEGRHWPEILAAAALQGAIFGLVKAAVDRAGATGARKLTGRWPA